jgi:serine/threonine protein kinase
MAVQWIGGQQVFPPPSPPLCVLRISLRTGALLYEMLSGLPPFYSRSREVMFEKIMKAELNFPSFLSDVSLPPPPSPLTFLCRLRKIF